MRWWLIGLALAGSGDEKSGDVRAEKVIEAPLEVIQAEIDSVKDLVRLFEDDCVTKVSFTPRSDGTEDLHLTYLAGPMRRSLTAHLLESVPGRVDFDHPGRKGFVTRVALTELSETHTRVQLTSYLNPPPWPFRKVYFRDVQPAWEACYDEVLQALSDRARDPRR